MAAWLATATFAALPAAEPLAPPVVDALNRYARGDYDGALRAIDDLDKLDKAFDDLRLAGPQWIHADGSTAVARRRIIAATVALEIAHARAPVSWRLRWPFVVWACELLRRDATHSPAERWWFLASVAVIEEVGDWADLIGVPRSAPNLPARRFFSPADQQEFRAGHLSHAKAAFAHEPRFLLAEVVAAERLSYLGTASGPPPHGIGAEEVPDTLIADLELRARGAKIASVADLSPDAARRLLGRIATMRTIARDFAALVRYDSVRGEVELHLGFGDLRVHAWDRALEHLNQVPRFTNEPFLLCLSHYFRGWVLQRSDRRGEAIAAYRQALEWAPGARSLSLLLAAQLAQAGQAADAYVVMDTALKANPAPADPLALPEPGGSVDPWTLFGLGEARLFPGYIAHLREALQ